jgi:hypothetical protein
MWDPEIVEVVDKEKLMYASHSSATFMRVSVIMTEFIYIFAVYKYPIALTLES